ncbi:MAG: protein translocase subunit SecDF, partial [Flavobacterium sp.]|nr:protein translocase subunit SecDF [Flavobacterium sp.]
MQSKGLIKFFAILFALVCIYQLSFTFVANKVKDDAKAYAGDDVLKEVKYLDSIGREKVFSLGFTDYTYNEVKDKQINKGLDLEGGINVILQISVKDILNGLANNSQDPTFNKALADATRNQKGNQTYLDAFFEAFDAESKGKVKLSSPDIFFNKNLDGEINLKMTDNEVKAVIKRKVNESVLSAFEVLRKRIDKFGVTQPNIQQLGESGRILVELPGAKDVDRIKKLLQSTAQLEFWETFKFEEVGQYLGSVNEALKATEVKVDVKEKTSTGIDSLLTDTAKDSLANTKGNNPLFDKMLSYGGGPVLGYFAPKDTAKINGYLKRDSSKALLTPELRYARFVWGKPTTVDNEKKEKVEAVELYALKTDRTNQAPISGGVVIDARDSFDQFGKPSVTMQMNGKGAKQWEELTGKA